MISACLLRFLHLVFIVVSVFFDLFSVIFVKEAGIFPLEGFNSAGEHTWAQIARRSTPSKKPLCGRRVD